MLGNAAAGKSTLLDLIAGRKTVGELQGDILFSGVRPSQAFLRRYTGRGPAPPWHRSYCAAPFAPHANSCPSAPCVCAKD